MPKAWRSAVTVRRALLAPALLAAAAVAGSAAATPYYYLVARTSFKGEQPPAEPTVPVQA